MDRAIHDTIRKCLALAESPNENEAKAAANKAHKLMMKYGIAEAEVQIKETGVASVRNVVVEVDQAWKRELLFVVTYAMNGKGVYWKPVRGSHASKVDIVAFDIESILELYNYLEAELIQLAAIATAERSEKNVHGKRWRSSYIAGFTSEIRSMLNANKRKLQLEAGEANEASDSEFTGEYGSDEDDLPAPSPSMALALLSIEEATEKLFNELHPNVQTGYSQSRSVNSSAYQAGRSAASSMNVGGRKSLNR